MTCEECQDLLPLYLTGALDAAEEAQVREHLASGCPDCAAALAREEALLHTLPLSLAARPAPAAAWDKIESRIAMREGLAGGAMTAPPEHAALQQPFIRRGPNWAAWTGWAAAAAVAVVLGLMLQNQSRQLAQQTALVNTLTEQKETTRRDYADLQIRFTDLERRLDSLSRDRDLQLAQLTTVRTRLNTVLRGEQFPLSGKDQAQPEATGKTFLDRTANAVVVLAANVKQLPPNRAYELWFIRADGTAPIASVVAQPDAQGNVVFEARLPAGVPLTAISAVAITEEDAAGSPVPTTPVQFLGPLASQ